MRLCAACAPGSKASRQFPSARGLAHRALVLALFCLFSTQCRRHVEVAGFPDSFVGVGLELTLRDEVPVVVRTIPGGPCALAGILPGDHVVAVSGKDTAGDSLGNITMRLRGQPNSAVDITVERNGHRLTMQVVRRAIRKGAQDYQPEGS